MISWHIPVFLEEGVGIEFLVILDSWASVVLVDIVINFKNITYLCIVYVC